MVREKEQKGVLRSLDWVTIILYLLLLGLGWMSVCGATYDFDQAGALLDFGSRSGMQIIWIGSSLLLGILILSIDERIYESFSYIIYAGLIVLLFITPFFAHNIKGSMSWIKIGSFSVQPAEFAKFGTALCLARAMSMFELRPEKTRDLIIVAILVLLPLGLIIMERETGSALVYLSFFFMFYREGMPGCFLFIAVAAVFYFVVGLRYDETPLFDLPEVSLGRYCVMVAIWLFSTFMVRTYTELRKPFWWLFGLGLFCTVAGAMFAEFVLPFDLCWVQLSVCVAMIIYLLFLAVRERLMPYLYTAIFAIGSLGFYYSSNYVLDNVMGKHQQDRIRILLGIENDPKHLGYNVAQAQIAIGSGGLHGKGFLNGTQTKLRYVPEQETDFIFCTVGEEEGFIGCTTVLLLFAFLLLRLVYVAERQVYRFGRIYGYCVVGIFFIHIFINVGMVLGLTPVIGIPLPFFSYGGSSLWGFTILLFIFLRIDAGRNKLKRD